MSLAKADMGVARAVRGARHRRPGDDRRWDAIETEYRRTVALLGRVTGRERLLDGVAGPPAVGGVAQPVRGFAVGAAGPAAGAPARAAGRRPRARAGPASRPADRQRRGGRSAEHRLGSVDHADHVAPAASGRRAGRHVGRHRCRGGRVHARARGPARAGRADRRGRSRSRARCRQTTELVRARFPRRRRSRRSSPT